MATFTTTKRLAEEAARQGRPVTMRYLQQLCRRGDLPAERPGKEYLILQEEAARWLRAWLENEAR